MKDLVNNLPKDRTIKIYFGSDSAATPRHPYVSVVGTYKSHDEDFIYLDNAIIRIKQISYIDLREDEKENK